MEMIKYIIKTETKYKNNDIDTDIDTVATTYSQEAAFDLFALRINLEINRKNENIKSIKILLLKSNDIIGCANIDKEDN